MEKKSVCIIEIAFGLALRSQKKMASAVESLVKKGELSKRQSEEFLRALQSEGAEFKKTTGKQILDSAKKVLGELGFVTAADIDKVHKEIVELKALLGPARSAEDLTA